MRVVGTGLPVRVRWEREQNQYFIKHYESCRDRFTGPCVLGERKKSIFVLNFNKNYFCIYVLSFFISFHSATPPDQ